MDSLTKKRRRRRIFAACFFVAIVVAVWVVFVVNINPVIRLVASSKVESQTYRAINNAVTTVVNGNVVYTDLVSVERNEQGDITMLQANSIRVNALARAAATMSQQNIARIGEQGIEIPVGTLSGIPLLSGKGFPVRLRLIPVGSVECQFVSEFGSAGVNQTRHKIYITITADVNIIIPGASSRVSTVTQMLITECILVGKVPDTYLNTSELDNAMDLVPEA